MALTPGGTGAGTGAGAAFVVPRLLTPGDGTQVRPRTWAWTGDGVVVEAAPDSGVHDRDLVTVIDGVPLGREGGWWAPPQRPGDRLVYQVVRGGQPQEVPVTLLSAELLAVAEQTMQPTQVSLWAATTTRAPRASHPLTRTSQSQHHPGSPRRARFD
jgi:hypothetical protein